MRINIKGTNLELTPSIYTYIEKKIGELERFIQNIGDNNFEGGSETVEAWVEVGKTTRHHNKGDVFRAELQIRLPGTEGVRAVVEEWDLYQAIDKVKEEMQGQLKKYKGKQIEKTKRGARLFKRISRLSSLAKFKKEK